MTQIYRVTETQEAYKEMARQSHKNSADSFERCDTDGFLSQWAGDQMARIYNTLAWLAEKGGKSEFTVLADLDGNRVERAKPIRTRYGVAWGIINSRGGIDKFLPYKPARESTLAKRGYKEITVTLPALVRVDDGGAMSLNVFCYPEEWMDL